MSWRFGLLVAAATAQQCVTKQTITAGDGVTFPKSGDTVSMHYTGTLVSGTKFDSSKDRGKEFTTQIGIGQVIQGWDQGVPQMSLGEHAILRISAACGYGARGSPPVIPANADLVFDVELNGLNGRRASAGTQFAPAPVAPLSFSPQPMAAVAPVAASFGATASLGFSASAPNLPSCTKADCGRAISFDKSANSRPVCLCNPICQEWKTTLGILPCCPGLQRECLDPYRSPSPQPPAATRMTLPAVTPMPLPAATPVVAPMTPMPAAISLPTCRPSSCGKAMASGVNSMTAVCACDASCLAVGSSLPCCQSFKEICQAPPLVAATLNVAVSTPAPMQQSQPQASATATSQSSGPAPQLSPAKPASASTDTSATVTVAPSKPAGCALGMTKWAEQPACDKKRWAIQNGKCNKVCPAIDTQAGIKYYPTGSPGKAACAAALALCKQ